MNRFVVLQKILELGSFTKAATVLGYTQSSISQIIASLEAEFGVKLLNRSRTGVSLTLEGQQLYPLIEQTIHSYHNIEDKASEIKGLDRGTIRVGTFSSVTCHWLPQLIKQFKTKYPQIDFVFYQGDYTLIPEWIKNDTVDFGFTTPESATDLTTQIVKQGKMLAVLPKTHPLAKRATVPLTALCQDPFILLEEGQISEPLLAFAKQGLTPNVAYRIHDDYAIMTMVEAGLGVSVLAELVLQRMPFDVVTRPIEPPITREIAIAYKDQAHLPIASQYFIRDLMQAKDQLP